MITKRRRSALAGWLRLVRRRRSLDPRLRANLAAWYHTGAGLIADAAGNVSQWQDQSGNGRPLLQASGAAQPLLTRADNQGNLLQYSEQFDQPPWVLTGATVAGAVTPPPGVAGAQNISNFNGAAGERLAQTYQLYASMSGRRFRAYLWLKGAYTYIGKTVLVYLLGASGTTNAVSVVHVLTGDWVRVDTGLWTGGADTCGVKFMLQCPGTTSDGPEILQVTGAQLIEEGTATAYVPTTGFAQPPGFQGRKVVCFNGSTHYLKTAAFTLNQPETLYLVMRLKSFAAWGNITDGYSVDSGDVLQQAAAPAIGLYAGSNGPVTSDLPVNTWGILTGRFAGADSLIQANARAAIIGNAGTASMGGLTLGAMANTGHKSNVELGEVLLYAAAHDSNAIGRVVNYLAHKWGIAL